MIIRFHFLFPKQEHFWNLDKSEFRIPPKLIVQIWDNDKFSLDDYLGTYLLVVCLQITVGASQNRHTDTYKHIIN